MSDPTLLVLASLADGKGPGADIIFNPMAHLGFGLHGHFQSEHAFIESTGAVDVTRFKQPVEVNTDNTEILLDGYAANVRSWRADAGSLARRGIHDPSDARGRSMRSEPRRPCA